MKIRAQMDLNCIVSLLAICSLNKVADGGPVLELDCSLVDCILLLSSFFKDVFIVQPQKLRQCVKCE